MPVRTGYLIATIVTSALLAVPEQTWARGGPSGGTGGMGRGGGPVTGARPYTPGVRGYTGGGYHGPAAAPYRGRFAGYHGPVNAGYPGWGYPGYYWGYPYYGYGLGFGLGLGVGYSAAYGYPNSGATYYVADNSVTNSPVVTASNSAVEEVAVVKTHEFVRSGEVAFKEGKYDEAAYCWRHAIVDDPRNGLLVLRLSQALFATGKFHEAAGATQAAMRQLPVIEWGTVIKQYQDLYGNSKDYTQQLQSLEAAVKTKPNAPATRFLLAYHYGYLGFVKQSIEQLEKTIDLEPRDEIAKKLRDEMKGRQTISELPPVPAPVPELP